MSKSYKLDDLIDRKMGPKVISIFIVLFSIVTPAFNQNGNRILTPGIPPTATITGRISSFNLEPYRFGELILKFGNLQFPLKDISTKFTFETVETELTKLELRTSEDCLNGVNVGDIVKIQNHILQKTLLDRGNKLIAADVNMDGKISVADILELRKLILGKTDIFSAGISTTFIDEKYPIYTNNWFLAPHYILIDPVDTAAIRFKSIKLGDVDLNAKAEFDGDIELRNNKTLDISIPEQNFNTKSFIRVPFLASDRGVLTGLQFSIYSNPDHLQFINVEDGALSISNDQFSISEKNPGLVHFAIDEEEVVKYSKDEVLFYMLFASNIEGKLSTELKFNVSKIPYLAFDDEFNSAEIQFLFKKEIGQVSHNFPNPFRSETNIRYNLEESKIIDLRIYDLAGNEVYLNRYDGRKGDNSLQINHNMLKGSGVYLYTLNNQDKNFASGKLVLLN